MPRKPDRFERDIRKFTLYGSGACTPKLISIHDAVTLLRKEHRWVERMVKDIAQDYESSVGDTAAEMLRDEILAKLRQRRK